MRTVRSVAMVLIAAAGPTATLAAEAQTCDDREARAAVEQAKKSEAAGKLSDAVILYRHAARVCPTSAGQTELHRIGRSFAAKAEAQGRLYGSDELLRVVPDEACRNFFGQMGEGMKGEAAFGRLLGSCEPGGLLVVNERASAYAWLEGTGNHAEADRVMIKLAKAKSDDLTTFRIVHQYFESRRQQSPELAPTSKQWRELQAIASESAQRHLAAEEKEAAGLRLATLGESAADRSLAELHRAGEWLRFVPDGSRRVAARAEQRGDHLAQADAPRFLREAVRYYELAGAEPKIKQIHSKAERLGETAARNGEYAAARQYFELAGNTARAEDMERRSRQQEMQTQKSEEARKKFRKEQDDLEKELNLK